MNGSVLVTRPAGAASRLARGIEALGLRVHAVPTIATEATPSHPPSLEEGAWVIVSSANGVRHSWERLRGSAGRVHWAAVGPATGAALSARGVKSWTEPADGRPESLVGSMGDLRGAEVLVVRGDLAGEGIAEDAEAAGALVRVLIAYRTQEGPEESRQALEEALADPALRLIVLASGSAARGLVRLSGRVPDVATMTIGPSTSAVARDLGFKVVSEASDPSVGALLREVEAACV